MKKPRQFEDATRHCKNGIVYVMRDGKKGYRDKEGRWLARPVFGWYSDYIPCHKVVWEEGYIYDADSNRLNHYANHMLDGYKHLASQSCPEAAASFRAALRINPATRPPCTA
jgi:transposase